MTVTKTGRKIRKWDEVTGNAVEIQIPETVDPVEDVGLGPSISRNHMRGIEDMVEQNDNCFDGIINNVAAPETPDSGTLAEQQTEAEIAEETKASVMAKIREQQEKTKNIEPTAPEKKPLSLCPCREM